MPKITIKHVGAGGNWKVIDEKPDASVVKQLTPFSCVAAVGEMLLRGRGISLSQQEIIDIIGEVSGFAQLADALQRIDDGQPWFGGVVATINLESVAKFGEFAALLREGRPLGHMVLVREIIHDRVIIADPWEATVYGMTRDVFSAVWNGEVVFLWT